MDKNGYNDSLYDTKSHECYYCHSNTDTVRHEVFYGAQRQSAKALGLWLNLCPVCHRLVHEIGEDGKPSKDWRKLGITRLIDALARETDEMHATMLVYRYVNGSIKNWELKEMEELYGKQHGQPRLD